MLIDSTNVAQFIASTKGSGAVRISRDEAAKYGVQFADSRLASSLAVSVALPEEHPHPAEYDERLGWVDQQWVGECTAEMSGIATQYTALLTYGIARRLSGMFNYCNSAGSPRQFDNGATVGGALQIAMMFGMCRDEYWPDSIKENWDKVPTPEAYADALNQKILEVVYLGEGHDAGMIDRVRLIIANGGVVCFGIGDHALCATGYRNWGIEGQNCKGPPNPNFNGKFGVFWDVLSSCWNLYTIHGVNYTGHDLLDPERWIPTFHQMWEERFFALGTLITALGDNPMSAQTDAVKQAWAATQGPASILGSAIAALPGGDAPPGLPPTTTALTATPNPATVGQAVTLRATVTGASPTGNVTFKDGQALLGSAVALSGGVATSNTSALAQGAHSITASYGGDAGNAASTSAAVSVTVNAAGGGGNIIHNYGDPPIVKSGVTWKLDYSESPWGFTVNHNEVKDASAHQIVWDAVAGQIKVVGYDKRQPNPVYEWKAWTGSGYVATTAP